MYPGHWSSRSRQSSLADWSWPIEVRWACSFQSGDGALSSLMGIIKTCSMEARQDLCSQNRLVKILAKLDSKWQVRRKWTGTHPGIARGQSPLGSRPRLPGSQPQAPQSGRNSRAVVVCVCACAKVMCKPSRRPGHDYFPHPKPLEFPQPMCCLLFPM